MEIVLGTPYSPSWAGVPKSMSTGDYAIWARYLSVHGEYYQEFYYDVELRLDQELPANTPAKFVENWARSTAKRIDVLAFKLSTIELIEVRVNASNSALGAILTYRHYLGALLNDPRPITSIIVTDRVDQSIIAPAAANQIEIIEA